MLKKPHPDAFFFDSECPEVHGQPGEACQGKLTDSKYRTCKTPWEYKNGKYLGRKL